MTRPGLAGIMLLVIILLALSIAGACAPASAPAPTPAPAPKPTAAPAPSPSTAPAPAPAPKPTATPAGIQPKPGGILRVPLVATPPGYDMHRMPSYGPVIAYMVFSNLVRFDPNKADLDPDFLIPDLAEKWEASADKKTYTFYLYKNVKWHDGKPFTADDVVYSMQKIVDPKRSSNAAAFPSFDRAEKVDDYTVKMYLKKPSPAFLAQLAGPYAVVQAKHLADVDWKTTQFMVGTGPFKFKNYTSGVSYEFVKNTDYFRKDSAGRALPYLDGVTMYVLTDRSAQMDAVATNRLDMTMPVLGTYDQELTDRLKSQAKTPLAWQSYSNTYGTAYWFNAKFAPFKDPRVKQALVMLLDRKQLCIAGFGSDQLGNLDHALFAPAYGLPTNEINKMLGWDKPWDARVAAAKQLLADAGYTSGFKMRVFLRNAVPQLERQVVLLTDIYRRELKLDIQLSLKDQPELIKLRDAGDFDLLLDDTRAYVSDPDEIVPMLRSGSRANFVGYSNPDVDKLIDEQSETVDLAKRKQMVKEIERQVLKDLPVLPSEWRRYPAATYPYVKGFVMQNVGYGSRMAFEQVWLDK